MEDCDPWGRQEANMSPLAFQAHCLERVSRPWCGEDKPGQGPVNSLSCGDRDGSLAGVHRTACLRGHTERSAEGSTEGPPSHIPAKDASAMWHACEESTLGRERTLAERIQRTVPVTQT